MTNTTRNTPPVVPWHRFPKSIHGGKDRHSRHGQKQLDTKKIISEGKEAARNSDYDDEDDSADDTDYTAALERVAVEMAAAAALAAVIRDHADDDFSLPDSEDDYETAAIERVAVAMAVMAAKRAAFIREHTDSDDDF